MDMAWIIHLHIFVCIRYHRKINRSKDGDKSIFIIELCQKKLIQYTHINQFLHSLKGGQVGEGPDGAR